MDIDLIASKRSLIQCPKCLGSWLESRNEQVESTPGFSAMSTDWMCLKASKEINRKS